jgi:hypothetical protein
MSAIRIFEKKIVLCKKGDEITGLDGIDLNEPYYGKREKGTW